MAGKGQRHVVHTALYQVVAHVLEHRAEEPGDLRATGGQKSEATIFSFAAR